MERDLHSYIYCSAGTVVCLTQPICMGLAAGLSLIGESMLFSCQRQFKGHITFSAFPLLCFSIALYWNLSHMHFVLNQDVSLMTTFDLFAAKSSD